MTELILHMNNYSITGAITAYQTCPKYRIFNQVIWIQKSKMEKQIHLEVVTIWSYSRLLSKL